MVKIKTEIRFLCVAAKVAIVASILQKPIEDNKDSYNMGEYKVCKPQGLKKFKEVDGKEAVEYNKAIQLNMEAHEMEQRNGCFFKIQDRTIQER